MQDHLLDEKLASVRHYLSSQFPDHIVHSKKIEDPQHAGWPGYMVRIDRGDRKAHLLYLTQQFLDDHKVPEIDRLLRERRLAETLREAGRSPVLVTKDGLTIAD